MNTVRDALRRPIAPAKPPAAAAPKPKLTEAQKAEMLLAAFPKCC